jgi:hypothetical protein
MKTLSGILMALALLLTVSFARTVSADPSKDNCYKACAAQQRTCEKGCQNGSMEHVQACLVRCESGGSACRSRC